MLNRLRSRTLAALTALALAVWPVAAGAYDDIQDASTTAASNSTISSVSIAEGSLAGLLNDALRALSAQLKRAVANKGSNIASASSTAICATGTSIYAHITGTTTITSFGTAAAGCWRLVVFDGALTLTYNASSMILPGGVDITTAAGDAALAVSDGSGNWQVLVYQTAAGGVVGGFSSLTATSTDAGAGAGPDIAANRNSASAADSDLIGRYQFTGRDDASNAETYASIDGKIVDSGSGSEDAEIHVKTDSAGTLADRLIIGAGVQVGSAPTGGDKGAGTVNADTGVYIDGVSIGSTVIQTVVATPYTTYTADSTHHIPSDNTIPQSGEGLQIFSQAITPKSASSTIVIRSVCQMTPSGAGGFAIAALFKDAGANALKAAYIGAGTSQPGAQVVLEYSEASASASARTYKINVGADAGTLYINGDSSARLFGGVSSCTMIIEERL